MASLRHADSFVCLPHVFGFSIYQLGHDLVSSIESDGYVPYVIGHHERYRSSPLASCITYLWDAGLLPADAVRALRERLFEIRDRMPTRETRAPRVKAPEDTPAWCVSEGASVWSTSMALLALLESRIEPNRKQDKTLIEAVEWLIGQQDKDSGGWPFQQTQNSTPTVPMTGLTLRALSRAVMLPDITSQFRNALQGSINSGITYLKSKLMRKDRMAFWMFDGYPSLTATVWALEAFRLDPRDVNHDLPKSEILRFAVSQIPHGEAEWKSECFVKEPRTKYAHQKTFYTFMPSLLSALFENGLSPIEPKAVAIIQQLVIAGRDKCRIKDYDMQPCTFTHAMALHTLVKWCTKVQNVLVAGFFSPNQRRSTGKSYCPVYETNPSMCFGRSTMRRAYILLGLCLASVLATLAVNPEVRKVLDQFISIVGKTLFNQWFMTLVIGIIASFIAAFLWHHFQQKKNK